MPRRKDDSARRRQLRKRKEQRKKDIGWNTMSGDAHKATAPPIDENRERSSNSRKARSNPDPHQTVKARGQNLGGSGVAKKPKKKKGCSGLFVLIAILGGGYVAYTYLVNKPSDYSDEDWEELQELLVEDPIDLSEMDGTGQELFEAGCAHCHTIGEGDLVGPDLMNILERRDEHWILAFLKRPDKYKLADPDAAEVDAAYPYANQPEVGLTFSQLEDILEYIEEESATVSDDYSYSD